MERGRETESKCVRFIDFPINTDNLGYRTELSINFITEIKPIALVLCTGLGQKLDLV